MVSSLNEQSSSANKNLSNESRTSSIITGKHSSDLGCGTLETNAAYKRLHTNGSSSIKPERIEINSTSNSITDCPPNAHLGYQQFDLICVGFGPASLAIAIALRDRAVKPRVLFLERQLQFSWHAGMLLPGSRMQISFLKDLATLRDPTSQFTFLNYLHKKNRLSTFINLGTFLPYREEYNDYLAWCASHFEDQVRYGEAVRAIDPIKLTPTGAVSAFKVISIDQKGTVKARTARHVVVAVGGRPNIPNPFSRDYSRCIHSSEYVTMVSKVLSNSNAPYKIAVIGSGQSAAEIFSDLHTRYPNCNARLIIKGGSLRPSDDSPFVNEVFNPEKVDEFFPLPASVRAASIYLDKSTNYGVVRLELLERIYDYFYLQRLRQPDSRKWQHQILSLREIIDAKQYKENVFLRLRHVHTGEEEEVGFDAVIIATGYVRDVHEQLLANAKDLLAIDERTGMRCWAVGRDYRLQLDKKMVSPDTGIWLQGCCESTHGLSDTLLSILSIRSGHLVDSIFGRFDNIRQ